MSVELITLGVKFPDDTIQTTAYIPSEFILVVGRNGNQQALLNNNQIDVNLRGASPLVITIPGSTFNVYLRTGTVTVSIQVATNYVTPQELAQANTWLQIYAESKITPYDILGSPVANVQIDVLQSRYAYYSANSTIDYILNITGNNTTLLSSVLSAGDAVSVQMFTKNGAVPHYPTSIQVDGNTATVLWVDGISPTSGNANSVDKYLVDVVKIDDTPSYAVFASQTKYA